jgi:hypothetical protein
MTFSKKVYKNIKQSIVILILIILCFILYKSYKESFIQPKMKPTMNPKMNQKMKPTMNPKMKPTMNLKMNPKPKKINIGDYNSYSYTNGRVYFWVKDVSNPKNYMKVYSYLNFPKSKSNKLKMIFHGTSFGKCEDRILDDGGITLTICQSGDKDYNTDKTYGKSKWMVIEEIQLYIDRLLPIVYDIFNKYDYNKSHSLGDTLSGIIPEASINNEQLYLFIYGHSQGGTSAFSAHYFFQTSKTKIVQNNFNLIHTVCSAGIYFSDILKDSTLLKLEDYKKSKYITSCISPNNLDYSKRCQDIVLYNFIYIILNLTSPEPTSIQQKIDDLELEFINYTPADTRGGASHINAYKTKNHEIQNYGDFNKITDNWFGFDKLINNLDQCEYNYKGPMYLTPKCVTKLYDPNSKLNKTLTQFYKQNLPLDYFTQTTIKNLDNSVSSPKISLFYSKNDINFIASHAEYIKRLNLKNMYFNEVDKEVYNNDKKICPNWFKQHGSTSNNSNQFFNSMYKKFPIFTTRPFQLDDDKYYDEDPSDIFLRPKKLFEDDDDEDE